DRRERTQPHQHFTVAGDHRDATLRLRQREPEADHGGATHRAPEIEVAVVVAGGSGVPRGRAKPGDKQQIVTAAGEQRSHGGAAFEAHLVHTLLPMSCCDKMTAAMRSPPKACWTARSALPATSCGV